MRKEKTGRIYKELLNLRNPNILRSLLRTEKKRNMLKVNKVVLIIIKSVIFDYFSIVLYLLIYHVNIC